MTAAELVVIRHAQPERVEHEVGAGVADPGLSELGHVQARLLAEWLAPEGFEVVYASPMRRAVETAQPLAAALGLEVVTDDDLCEFDRGHHSYVPIEQMRAGDPGYDRMLNGMPPMEVDVDAFGPVAHGAVERLADAHPGQRVAVFSHGGVINCYTSRILGLPRWLFFAPHYTGVCRFRPSEFFGGAMTMCSLNEAPHLRGAEAPLPG